MGVQNYFSRDAAVLRRGPRTLLFLLTSFRSWVLALLGITAFPGGSFAQSVPSEETPENVQILVGTAADLSSVYISVAIAFLCLAVIVFGYIFWKFRKIGDGKSTSDASKHFSRVLKFVILSIVLVLTFGVSVSLYSLSFVKKNIIQDLDKNLINFITSANERLDTWTQQQVAYLSRVARDPELVAATNDLLSVQIDSTTSEKEKQKIVKIRQYFSDIFQEFSGTGFYVVDSNGKNIATEADINLGWDNLIAEQRPDIFQRVLNGESVFISPITSEIPLPGISTPDLTLPPAMFFAVPIQNQKRATLAALIVRVNPSKELTNILQLSNFRDTGETYAFNGDGFLLSGIRFTDQVRSLGLVPENYQAPFNLELLDPGGNLLQGFSSTTPRHRLPHMLPVISSLAISLMGVGEGTSGIVVNSIGYRDYRGVTVFGA